MKKTNFDYVRIFTIAIMVIVLILSFLPIIPFSRYTGEFEPETHKAIYLTEYKAFYTILSTYSKDVVRFGPFMMVMCFFLFYFASVLSIAYLLFNQNNSFKIAIAVSVIAIVPYAGAFVYVSIFALIVTLVYMALFAINIIDTKYKEYLSSKDGTDVKQAENMLIAKRIKTRRKELKMTQQDVANNSFMSRSLISKIESGKVIISNEHIERLSSCLSCDFSKIVNNSKTNGDNNKE